mmetsp:Transcript_37934/g.113498  ORF Transcript_37934/g.113498 Transcript_37934/m.113498 type:complete len:273 (-) Transcript_37934:54-872(-)
MCMKSARVHSRRRTVPVGSRKTRKEPSRAARPPSSSSCPLSRSITTLELASPMTAASISALTLALRSSSVSSSTTTLASSKPASSSSSSPSSITAGPTAAAAAAFHTISILEPRRCRHRRCSFRAESATKTGGLRSSRMRTQPCASRIIAAASRAVRGLSPLIARMRSNVLMMGASEPSERRCAASEPGNTVRTVGCAGHERISEMPIRIPARGLNTSTTSSGPPAVAAPSPLHDIGLVAPRSSPGDSSPLLLLADEGHRGQVRRIDVSNMG